MRVMPASFQRRMWLRSSTSLGRRCSHVRTVRSSIGAVLVRSSPRTRTASAPWTSAADPSRRRGSAAISSTAPTRRSSRLGHAAEEAVGPDERAQRVVGLQRGARRADADGAAAAQQARRGVERQLSEEGGRRLRPGRPVPPAPRRRARPPGGARPLPSARRRSAAVPPPRRPPPAGSPMAGAHHRLRRQQPGPDPGRAHPLRRVHELEPEAAAVAEEHLVDVAVEAPLHAAQLAVARRERRRAAEAAVRAHRRRRLQVPLARVAARERLVVEHAGGAHLDEVAAELALERAALGAPEVHLVAQAEHAEVAAAGVVVVEARAAVAGDAAVELVRDERSQVLVLEGPLAAAVAPVAVPRHHRHVLQVALAALVADRAVVRVAEHHELDHLGAEADRLRVEDVHPACPPAPRSCRPWRSRSSRCPRGRSSRGARRTGGRRRWTPARGASRRTAGRSRARGRRRACCGPLRPGTRRRR